MIGDGSIRRAQVAGSFYPGDVHELKQSVGRLLENAGPLSEEPQPLALLAPHAGIMYSGQTAAFAYRRLHPERPTTVVIIGPSHMEAFPYVSVYDGDAYETPLGIVPIDRQAAAAIVEADHDLRFSQRGHVQPQLAQKEHSLEVQLPFLQESLASFQLVPIIMGTQRWDACEALGNALAGLVLQRDVLLVASSDLSHFYDGDTAARMDRHFCELLTSMDARALYEGVQQGVCEACGIGAVAATLLAVGDLPSAGCQLLDATHSGMVTGDDRSVVGYASAVFNAVPPPVN